MTRQTQVMWITSIVASLLLLGVRCHADDACGEVPKSNTYTCQYSDTCRDSVIVSYPSGERIDHYTCEAVSCCQQLFTSCYDDGQSCSQIPDAAVRERVAQAAATSRVLVADCRGRYALYGQRPDRKVRNFVSVDDHILR